MLLKDRLQTDMKNALRAGDKDRLGVLRLALAAVKQREIDSRRELDDAGVEGVIEKMVKQGSDAAAQFEAAGRDDLAAKELAEIAILRGYLPEPLTAGEIDTLIADCIARTAAQSVKDMGRVMSAIKAAAGTRVDLGTVNTLVRAALEDL